MGNYEERESEAQTLMATPIRGYADGSAASTVTPGQGFYGDPSRTAHTIPALRTMEDGTTTSELIQTTPASRTWNSSALPMGTVLRRDRLTGRTRMMVTGEFIPEDEDPQVSAINVGILRATSRMKINTACWTQEPM